MSSALNTKKLVYLTVFLIPLYLIRFSLFSIPTNIFEVLVLLTFIVFLFSGKKVNLAKFFGDYGKILIGITLIIAGLVISTLVNDNYRSGFGIIKGWFIIPLIFSFVILNTITSRKDAINMLKILYFSSFFIGIIGLAYLFSGKLTYDGRLSAIYLSPNHLAMFLAPSIIIGIFFIMSEMKGIKYWMLVLNLLILLIALYFTYSYSAWAAIVISIGSLLLLKRSDIWHKSTGALLMVALVLILIFSQIGNYKFNDLKNIPDRSSLSSRMMIWEASVRILGDNPIFGIGPGNFQSEYLEYQKYFPSYLEWAVPHPHNLYLAFWLQGGILGIFGFLYLVIIWINRVSSLIMGQKNGSFSLLAALFGIMIYILLHGIIDTPYWKNDLAMIFWITFSLGYMEFKNL